MRTEEILSHNGPLMFRDTILVSQNIYCATGSIVKKPGKSLSPGFVST